MRFFEKLPPGLWFIKWIDRFALGRSHAESPYVHVALQRLPSGNLASVGSLSRKEIAYLLGRRPSGTETHAPEFHVERVLAAYLPELRVGQVIEEGTRVGKLPSALRRVSLDEKTEVLHLKASDERPTPEDWSVGPYRLLNKFDFSLEAVGMTNARCLVFRQNKVEYIIPKMVIFQTYFGLSSTMVNKICGQPWLPAAKDLICFDNFESGISTSVCPESGSWKIVLKTGMKLEHAPMLALLWFDSYARTQANALHTDSMEQNMSVRGGDGRSWFSSANIPHRFGPNPFQMEVRGYFLRPFRPSDQNNEIIKFIVTEISRSSWSLPDQIIETELENSNTRGEEQNLTDERAPYGRGRPPVEADPEAVATSTEDPDTNSSTNWFQTNTFEFINPPQTRRQAKESNKTYPPSPPIPHSDSASVLSGGNSVHGGHRPAKGSAEQGVRQPSKQFSHLLTALDELVAKGHIDSHKSLSPPEDSGLVVFRNGRQCWSCLSPKSLTSGRVPKTGWEVAHDTYPGTNQRTGRRHARCLLIQLVQIGGRTLVLFEIEPRSSGDFYCLYAFEQDRELIPSIIQAVISQIRFAKGRFSPGELSLAFEALTANKVWALKHYYTYALPEKSGEPMGINALLLHGALSRVLTRA